MPDSDTSTAEAQIREQIKKLSSQLDGVMKQRRANESEIEELTARRAELRRQGSQIAAEEGKLRGEIGELKNALKGLKR